MRKVPPPQSQIQEVLYELLNRLHIDRQSMMLSCGIFNLPARILDLRNKGVSIISNKVQTVNKFGREIEFIRYSIPNKIHAREIYHQLQLNHEKYVTKKSS